MYQFVCLCVRVCVCVQYTYKMYSQGVDNRADHTGPVVTVLLLRVVEGEHNSLLCGDPLLTTLTHPVGWFINGIQ